MALEKKVRQGHAVAIKGIRTNAEPNRFQSISVSFEIWGVSRGRRKSS